VGEVLSDTRKRHVDTGLQSRSPSGVSSLPLNKRKKSSSEETSPSLATWKIIFPALLKTPPLGCPAQNGVRDDTFGRRRTHGTTPATTHERVHSRDRFAPRSISDRRCSSIQGGPF
jgi:hypothetical protein